MSAKQQPVRHPGESMFPKRSRCGYLPLLILFLVARLLRIQCADVCQDGTGSSGTGALCDCRPLPSATEILRVDCSRRTLTAIPLFPTNTGVLDLTNNNIPVIHAWEFRRLDTLLKIILTGNPLVCDCALTDFKSWVINLQSFSATAQLVEGAVCGDSIYQGTDVLDAYFCFTNLLCYQLCASVGGGTSCSSQLCFINGDTCMNDVNYAADGSVSVTKSCAYMEDCRQAAVSANGAECRQTEGATSRCVYCCQGDNCNEELNTVNDSYVFPFRRPLAATTLAPNTADSQQTTHLASTPAEPSSTSETQTTSSREATRAATTADTGTQLLETVSLQTDNAQSSVSFSSSDSSYFSSSQTSVSSQETAPTRTGSMVPTSQGASTGEPPFTRAGSQAMVSPTETAPTRPDSLVPSTESSSTSESHPSSAPQTSVFSPVPTPTQTGSLAPTSEPFSTRESSYLSTGSQTSPTTTRRGTPTSETPRRTEANAATSQGSTARPTTVVGVTSPCGQVPPGLWCPGETSEGEWGSITWPAVVANGTAVVACPLKSLTDPGASRDACRTCLWDATSKRAVWGNPDVSGCPTASEILEELAKIEITESNVLAVSDQLAIVTSYAATLTADDVNRVVGALKRLLDALIKYPDKGQEIFKDAMATAEQTTSAKFEDLVAGQKMNRTTSRLLQLIDDFVIHVPFLNASRLTWESRAIDVITLDVAGRPISDLVFGGLAKGDDVEPFVGLNGSSLENRTDVVGSVEVPSSLLEKLGPQLIRTQFLFHQITVYFDVITSSVAQPYSDLTPATEGATTVLNSAVISASIGNLSIADLQEPVLIRLKMSQAENATNPQCVFWDTEANDKQGAWSAKGCAVNFELSDSTTVACECNHLTNFAMLMDVYDMGELDPIHSKILAILSYIGCSLSILTLTLAVITLGCCKEEPKYRITGSGSLNTGTTGKDRADRHTKILLHLSVGLILADASFLLNAVTVQLDLGRPACLAASVATHYSLLAAMAWMALEAFNMYLALVLVFDKYYTRFMLKMCLFGWGTPLIVVVTTFAVNFPDNYGLINGICWLARTPFLAAFLAPVCAALLFNTVVFLVVTWQLCKMRRRNISQSRRRFDLAAQFRASASITFLFGLTWAFALFGIGEARLAFSYLFAIFNSAQGFNIFVFQCLLKPSIRQRWLKWLRRGNEDIQGSSRSSGSKDSKNVEMFKVAGSAHNSDQPTARL